MPHTSRKAPLKKKRSIIVYKDGWATISRSSTPRTSSNHEAPKHVRQDPDLTLAKLQRQVDSTAEKWKASASRAALLALLRTKGYASSHDSSLAALDHESATGRRTIDKAVLLALGSLSSADTECWRARLQLVAFLDLCDAIRTRHGPDDREPELYIQEPELTELDKEFLVESLGFRIVEDHDALQIIDARTLLFVAYMNCLTETSYRVKARQCPLYATADMKHIIESGERNAAQRKEALKEENWGSTTSADREEIASMLQQDLDMIQSAEDLAESHTGYVFPDDDDSRALPDHLYFKL